MRKLVTLRNIPRSLPKWLRNTSKKANRSCWQSVSIRPAYYAKLVELDGYLARIVKAVEDAGIIDDTVFIITSDHGGINKGHGGKTWEEMETPLIVAGKGIRTGGVQLTESIVQYDVAATMAYILRLKQPQAWVGRPIMSLFK